MAKKSIASTNISIGANLTGLTRGLKIAQRSLRKFGASAKRMGSSISRNVSMPFALAGAAGVKMATDLEGSFAKIENLVGITGKALDDFKGSVKDNSPSQLKVPTTSGSKNRASGQFPKEGFPRSKDSKRWRIS